MKNTTLSYLIFALFALCTVSCSDPCDDPVNVECETGDADMDGVINIDDEAPSDPCLPEDNLACPTGDLDNDGLTNAEDSDPLERCLPDVPPVELNIIGTWTWALGTINFLDDGTYSETGTEFYSFQDGTEITYKGWNIKDGNGFTFDGKILTLTIGHPTGIPVSFDYEFTANECNTIIIKALNFDSEWTFTRVE